MTMEELRQKLVEYDRYMGGYPEHEYEGKSVWLWLTNTEPTSELDDAWEAEIGHGKQI